MLEDIIAVVLVLVILVAVGLLWKRIRPGGSHVQMAHTLLSDIRINQRLLELMINGEQVKRFCTTSWQMYQKDLVFLDRSVRKAIYDVYEIAEAYNEEVKGVKEFKTTNYVANIDLVKMLEQLRRSKHGIEDWLMTTTGSVDPAGKSNFLSGFLGR